MNLYDSLQDRLEGVVVYDGYFVCKCIFHPDNRPSLRVKENGYFDCMATSCGKRGTIKYLASQLKTSFVVSLKSDDRPILPQWKRWEKMFEDVDGIAQAAHRMLSKYPDEQWYFKKRKIDQFIKQGMFGSLDGWVLFPIFDQNKKIIDIVVRSTKGTTNAKYVLRPDNNREDSYLYSGNWDRISSADSLYVVFGIMDVWSLEALEFPAVTGTTGKSINPEILKDYKDKNIYIIPDRYEERDAHHLAQALGWRTSVLRLKWPDENYKDCDDIRRNLGAETLKQIIMEQM